MAQTFKPRKIVKKTNLNNPSLNSFGIIAAFNPQIPIMYQNNTNYYIALKQQMQNNKKQNINNKVRDSPYYNPIFQEQKISPLKRPSSLNQTYNSKLDQSRYKDAQNNLRNLSPQINYNDSKSIRFKQMHGYNIISNV